MMHLKYPRKRGFFHWDEMECLARSLGFRRNIFTANMQSPFTPEECKAIPVKDLLHMTAEQKGFHRWLDHTVNIHTDEWNLHVLQKAVKLINSHVLSFNEVHAIRVAYQLYEQLDTRGMPLDTILLQRAIKMCGRMISPLKMQHRIKHMKVTFEEEDRIQLHEFFNLILWCDIYENCNEAISNLDHEKDVKNMYHMDDFDKLLSHYDERLNLRLDKKYLEEEQTFAKVKHGSRQLPRDTPPVNPDFRKKQVKYHSEKFRHLHKEVQKSLTTLQQTKAGRIRSRPISAPVLDSYRYEPFEYIKKTKGAMERPPSVMDIVKDYIQPSSSSGVIQSKSTSDEKNTPTWQCYARPHTAPVVTETCMMTTRNYIDSLHFEISTLEHKYQKILNDDLDFILPGYKEWRLNNPPKVLPEPPHPKPPRKQVPSAKSINRLCYPPPTPSPQHVKTCDARLRGWHKVNNQPGRHTIVTKPTFNQSPSSALFYKMRETSDPRGASHFVRRYNRKHQSKQRTNTAPHMTKNHYKQLHNQWTSSPSNHKYDRLVVHNDDGLILKENNINEISPDICTGEKNATEEKPIQSSFSNSNKVKSPLYSAAKKDVHFDLLSKDNSHSSNEEADDVCNSDHAHDENDINNHKQDENSKSCDTKFLCTVNQEDIQGNKNEGTYEAHTKSPAVDDDGVDHFSSEICDIDSARTFSKQLSSHKSDIPHNELERPIPTAMSEENIKNRGNASGIVIMNFSKKWKDHPWIEEILISDCKTPVPKKVKYNRLLKIGGENLTSQCKRRILSSC